MGQIIFFLVVSLWNLLDSYIMLLHNKKKGYYTIEKKSKYVIILGIILGMSIGQFFLESRLRFLEDFTFFRYLGVFVMLLGLIIRMIAILQLGTSFTDHIMVKKEKALYKKGLYKFIRHPSYLGEIMIFLGVSFVYAYPLSSMIAFFIPTLAFLYRIHIEEKSLIHHYQDVYVDYQKETKKIIPFVY